MLKTLSIATLVALAGAACAASPYDEPYSIITVERARTADYHLKPVFINRVDGQNSVERNKHVVAPGTHDVTIDWAQGSFHLPQQTTIKLKTEPCVRYNMAARVENSVTQQWEPVVRSTEDIGECRAKFKIAGK